MSWKTEKSTKELSECKRVLDVSCIVSKTDTKWIITYINDKFCEISGYSEEELIWKPHNIVRHPDMPKKAFEDLWKTIKSKKVWRWVVQNRKKDWSSYWVIAYVVPLLDINNEIIEYMSIRTDITKEKKMEENVIKIHETEIDKLREISDLKDSFLSLATHELRTPLTVVKWYLSMILEWDIWHVNIEAKEYLAKVYKTTNNLISLISELLDLRKIESWKDEFKFDLININKLIRDMHEHMLVLSNKKKQKLILDIEYDDFLFNTDCQKLEIVLQNILSNSIKYTQEWWKIILKSYKEKNKLIISIIDNWFWISKENQKDLFKEFTRVKSEQTRDIMWTWLWLPIVKKILDKLKWDIIVVSKEWKWSEFKIILPNKKAK